MSCTSINDVASFINPSEKNLKLQELLIKAHALTEVALLIDFTEIPLELCHGYWWALNELIIYARQCSS